ncbi:hypothetical protein AB0O52_11465 [Arthrobacter sp. NPDC080073]|uniref:hypothetical protein n=1 Tax=Arthrobacter sp. NPDC080073 TaxID=3155919 RepID=UPI00341FAB5B
MSNLKVTVQPPFQVFHGGAAYGPGETFSVDLEHAELDMWLASGWATSDDPEAADWAQRRLKTKALKATRPPQEVTASVTQPPVSLIESTDEETTTA